MLCDIETLNVNDINLTEPKEISLKDGTANLRRVGIKIKTSNGKLEPLIISTDKCFSLGLRRKTGTSKERGYTFTILLKNKSDAPGELNPTPYQEKFLEVFEKIVDKCKDHCVESDIALKKEDLKEMSNGLYVKKEVRDGQRLPVPEYSPVSHAKVPYSWEKDRVITGFYEMEDVEDEEEGGQEVDPMTYLNRWCYARAAIKFNNISISENGMHLQVKVIEVNVKKLDNNKRKRMMSKVPAKLQAVKYRNEDC